jgi:signal peptidase I
MNDFEHARAGEDTTETIASASAPDAGVAHSAGGRHTDHQPTSDKPAADAAAARSAPDSVAGAPDIAGSDVPTANTATADAGDGTAAAETAAAGTPSAADDDEHAAAVARWRARSARRRKPAKKRPWWVEVPILLVTAFVLTFLIQTFFFKVYYVPSGSMEQTLHGVTSGGDRILVNKIVYDFRDPAPGDVVVFKGPPTWASEANIPGPTSWIGKLGQAVGSVVGIAPPNEKDFVKRVIAVGGQTVKCCDAQGNVTVDGVSLHEPYVFDNSPLDVPPNPGECRSRRFAEVTIPPGQMWVMGDHRSNSRDSSYGCQGGLTTGCQGPVPISDAIGKAIFIIMPVSRWNTLGNPGIDHRSGG